MPAPFAVVVNTFVIGHTRFEHADPPMGSVHGAMEPAPDLAGLRRTYAALPDPLPEEGEAGCDWPSPILLTPDGAELACSGATLFEHVDADGLIHFEVEAIGIEAEVFSRHFAHHIRAYRERF